MNDEKFHRILVSRFSRMTRATTASVAQRQGAALIRGGTGSIPVGSTVDGVTISHYRKLLGPHRKSVRSFTDEKVRKADRNVHVRIVGGRLPPWARLEQGTCTVLLGCMCRLCSRHGGHDPVLRLLATIEKDWISSRKEVRSLRYCG